MIITMITRRMMLMVMVRRKLGHAVSMQKWRNLHSFPHPSTESPSTPNKMKHLRSRTLRAKTSSSQSQMETLNPKTLGPKSQKSINPGQPQQSRLLHPEPQTGLMRAQFRFSLNLSRKILFRTAKPKLCPKATCACP